MTILRVQHAFQGLSGLPEDKYINTWYFTGDLASMNLPTLADAITSFYQDVPPSGTKSIASYMSGVADAPGASIKMYDLADALPREPLFERIYSPPAMGGSNPQNLPSELAICMSYSSPPLGGVPAARRRGRLYLGPWAIEALGTPGIGSEQTINGNLSQEITRAAVGLAGVAGGANCAWSQYSTVGGVATEISTVWVDDAWDIQRRRGRKPSSRYTVTI